jgi:hypothetical protein
MEIFWRFSRKHFWQGFHPQICGLLIFPQFPQNLLLIFADFCGPQINAYLI